MGVALPLSPATSLQPPASGHLETHSRDGTAGLRSSRKRGDRAPQSRDAPKPTPQSRSTPSARWWERSQFMKLNKVHGRRETPGEGASTLAGPAQLGLSTPSNPFSFPPGRAPKQPGYSLAAGGQGPRGGRSRRSRGAAGPPPPRCAGRGYTSGGSGRKAWQGQAGTAARAPPSPGPMDKCPDRPRPLPLVTCSRSLPVALSLGTTFTRDVVAGYIG